jgi:hypothetical protein
MPKRDVEALLTRALDFAAASPGVPYPLVRCLAN